MNSSNSTWISACKREWEKTIFGVCALALLTAIAFGVVVVNGWWEKDDPSRPPVAKVSDPFNTSAFTFLDVNRPPAVATDHAFRVKKTKRIKPPQRPGAYVR